MVGENRRPPLVPVGITQMDQWLKIKSPLFDMD